MLSSRLLACPACGRHVRPAEVTCPFCTVKLRADDGGIAPTRVAMLMGLALAFPTPGCSDYAIRQDGGEGGSAPSSTGTEGSGGAGGGAGGTSSTSTSVSTAATSSTATGNTVTSSYGAGCDSSGDCGDTTSGCVGCAIGGNCSDEYDSCAADQGCIDFSTCAAACPDQACYDLCVSDNPEGAAVYADLIVCIVCEECYYDCNGASSCP